MPFTVFTVRDILGVYWLFLVQVKKERGRFYIKNLVKLKHKNTKILTIFKRTVFIVF